MIDHIVEGKRRKLMELGPQRREACTENESSVQDQSQSKNVEIDTEHIDREALLKEELDKIRCSDENSTLVQTFTGVFFIYNRNLILNYEVGDFFAVNVYDLSLKASVWLDEEDVTPVEWQYPSTSTENLRYKTFKDLWERGYYLTGGQKFGADFLIYPGMHYVAVFSSWNIVKYPISL
jgi:tRNA-splicing endonuclease subunit Sen34